MPAQCEIIDYFQVYRISIPLLASIRRSSCLKSSRQAIERVARIYKNNQDASQALGITMRSFSRLCREYGIETPYMRKLNNRRLFKRQYTS